MRKTSAPFSTDIIGSGTVTVGTGTLSSIAGPIYFPEDPRAADGEASTNPGLGPRVLIDDWADTTGGR